MSYYLGIRLNNLKVLFLRRMWAQNKLWGNLNKAKQNKTKNSQGSGHSPLLSTVCEPPPHGALARPSKLVPDHSRWPRPPQTRSFHHSFLSVCFRVLGTRRSRGNLSVFSLAHLSLGKVFLLDLHKLLFIFSYRIQVFSEIPTRATEL